MKKDTKTSIVPQDTPTAKIVRFIFACPSCSSKREKKCKECSRCRSLLPAVQIHPAPTVMLTKEEARQILLAKSMTSGITRISKGKQAVAFEDDLAIDFY